MNETQTQTAEAGDVTTLREALKGAVDEYDRNTCQHDETHRGGAIWTICDGCGAKWADDEGGFVPYADPPKIVAARAALAASPAPRAPSAVPEGMRPMVSAPRGVPVIARHKPNDRMPDGWVGTVTVGDDDDESADCLDTIVHYNGDLLITRFHGCWEGWWPLSDRTLAAAPAAPPADGGTAEDRDDVLFAFHRYVDNPTPFEVTWWTRHFPQFAQDIREHAVEVIDMNFRAVNPNPDWAEQVARRICNEHDVGSATFDVAEALRNAEATGYTRGCATRPLSHSPIASFIARDCACCSDQPTVPSDCPACHGAGGFTRHQIAGGMIVKVPPAPSLATLSIRTPAGAGDPVGNDAYRLEAALAEAAARTAEVRQLRTNLINTQAAYEDAIATVHELATRPASPASSVSGGCEDIVDKAFDLGYRAGVEGWHYAFIDQAKERLGILPAPPAPAASPFATDDLVDRLAAALKAKLRNSEAKHGWNDAWAKPDWMMDCLRGLLRQVATGDPLGVATYAAFCWHHGWATAMPEQMETKNPDAPSIATDRPNSIISENTSNEEVVSPGLKLWRNNIRAELRNARPASPAPAETVKLVHVKHSEAEDVDQPDIGPQRHESLNGTGIDKPYQGIEEGVEHFSILGDRHAREGLPASPAPAASAGGDISAIAGDIRHFIQSSENGLARVPRQLLCKIEDMLRSGYAAQAQPVALAELATALTDVAIWLENDGRYKHARHVRSGIAALATAASAEGGN